MRKVLLGIFMIGSILPIWGQLRDTAYVETFQEKLLLSPYLRYRNIVQGVFTGGTASNGLVSPQNLGIRNFGLGLGLRASLGRLGLGGTMPLTTIYPQELKETRSFGLAGELMFRRVVVGGGIRYRTGFNTRQGNENVFREDLRRLEISVSTIYAFNYDRYSFRGPLRLVERQKQSAGSVLLAMQYQSHYFRSDSSITIDGSGNGPFQFDTYSNYNVLPGIGYGGTLVNGDWFLNAVFLAYAKVSLLGVDARALPTSLGIRPHLRFSIGHHSEKWFLSVNGLLEQDLNWGNKAVILEAQRTIYLAFGIRVDPPPMVRGGGKKIENVIY